MVSFGHTGGAVESTAVINFPGVFVTKDGNTGMRAVLKECSYSKVHNFNLLSMTRLLQQGLKVTCGDKKLIHIENGKDGKIDFDIIVPTKKGAIYACRFVHFTELETVSASLERE